MIRSFRVIHGDALTVLRTLPAESVHCVITSPPYFGLRDYGTAQWSGGDAACGHAPQVKSRTERPRNGLTGSLEYMQAQDPVYRDVCGKCGAVRVDKQIGLERTPDEFVARLVEVFREAWRVLRADGTVWCNLGDSYVGSGMTGGTNSMDGGEARMARMFKGNRRDVVIGLKPKDLCGIPWRVAFALQADGWYLRSDIIWAKPNPMPESVTDRPTKAHEYIFLLAKSERYWYDAAAIAEASSEVGTRNSFGNKDAAARCVTDLTGNMRPGVMYETKPFRNRRSVWTQATQPFNGSALLGDYVGDDGKTYKRSEDCPIHGLRRGARIRRTVSYDAQPDPSAHRIEYTANGRGLTPELESVAIHSRDSVPSARANSHARTPRNMDVNRTAALPFDTAESQSLQDSCGIEQTPVCSSDSDSPLCDGTAIVHSNGNHKTAPVPVTTQPCMPCAETRDHTEHMSELPVDTGSVDHNGVNSSGPAFVSGEKDSYPWVQTPRRTVDSSQCNCTMIMVDHFATFPEELIRPCVLAGCPIGGTVLDPFCGSGTAGVVALGLDRAFVGIELNPAYVEMARGRIFEDQPLFNTEEVAQ